MTAAAMTAPSRAEINRRNAQRSTGPRSVAGKQRVRFNALKHGIRAQTAILPGEEDAFRARLDAWTSDLQPRDQVETFLVTRAVEVSCQLDRAGRARETRQAAARHAGAGRLDGQAEEVVTLGRRLFWDPVGPLCLYPHAVPADGEFQRVSGSGDPEDPDDPARIVVRLEAMILGCAWLLDRWGELRALLEDGLLWQPPDRLKAIRMLGRQPLEAVDDRRVMAVYLSCWAMNPAERNGFDDLINDLAPKERTVYLERLNGRDPMAGMPENSRGGAGGAAGVDRRRGGAVGGGAGGSPGARGGGGGRGGGVRRERLGRAAASVRDDQRSGVAADHRDAAAAAAGGGRVESHGPAGSPARRAAAAGNRGRRGVAGGPPDHLRAGRVPTAGDRA